MLPLLVQAQEDVAAHVARLRAAVVGIAVSHANLPIEKPAPSLDSLNTSMSLTPRGAAVGSGTLISADGLILTVESLLVQGGEITVTLDGGIRRNATVVGKDRVSGLALLKINGIDLPHASLGSAREVAMGERVALLGRLSPDDATSPVVTEGLLSSAVDTGGGGAPMIQSTAQVLPGMGGGPLVRLKTGELIGIASHQYLPKVGVPHTFAVTSDESLKIAEELRSRGRVERAHIGITADLLPVDVARQLGLLSRSVMIVAVREGGPAQKAGVQVGDVLLSVDGGEAPRSAASLYQMIRARPPGSTLALRVQRRGGSQVIQVVSEATP